MSFITTIPTTDDEWRQLFRTTNDALTVQTQPRHHPVCSISKTIDHTLLKLDASPAQIDTLCDEARHYDFATVCVRPSYVAQCVAKLKGTSIGVASVIGFHEGTYKTEDKLSEVRSSVQAGATELDVVVNWPLLKKEQYSDIYVELEAIRQAAPTSCLKLIFETSQLNESEIIAACVLASASKFDFVKTSTGFLGHGAKVCHVRLMAACCDSLASEGSRMLVKASGGVRSIQDAETMLDAGASRLGTSAGVAIAQSTTNQQDSATGTPSTY